MFYAINYQIFFAEIAVCENIWESNIVSGLSSLSVFNHERQTLSMCLAILQTQPIKPLQTTKN